MIHPLSDCKAALPQSTNIWQFCVVFPEAKIGENCNICANVLIENDVIMYKDRFIGIFIDVFPVNCCPENELERESLLVKLRHYKRCV